MKRLAKIAVVVSSVALVGAYVLYQSGGSLFPNTKSGRIAQPAGEEQETVLSGSKSKRVFSPSSQPADSFVLLDAPVSPATQPSLTLIPETSETSPSKHLMYGSKSGIVVKPDDPIVFGATAATQPTTQPLDQRFSLEP